MKVSLILATVNRVNELEIFLKSLSNQTYQKFELILVDQNMDARLNEIVNKYRSTCKIKHIQAERGLSKARNVGFHHITGDIVAFPDDDC
jgi:glycosyltransferase involved in cell wall biosynthesis